MASPRKRLEYDAGFKLTVVVFARRVIIVLQLEFGLIEKLVRDWIKQELNLRELPKTKFANRGGKPHWPEFEISVVEWVLDSRLNDYHVARNGISVYTLKLAK